MTSPPSSRTPALREFSKKSDALEAHEIPLSTRHRLLAALAALVSLVLSLIGGARATSGGALWSPDMGPRIAQLKQFATTGTFLYLDNPDVVADPQARFFQLGDIYAVTVPKGLVSVYPPLYPALAYLPYRYAGLFGIAILSALGLVVAALGVYSLLITLRVRFAFGGALAFALATAVFSYGTVVWDHSAHIAIVAVAFAVLARSYLDAEKHPAAAALGGALLGFGLYFHILFAILGGCWAVAALALGKGRRAWLIQFVAAFGFVAFTWLCFNVWAYGAPFGPQTIGANSLARPENRRLMFDLNEVVTRAVDQLAGEGEPVSRRLTLVVLGFAAALGLLRPRALLLGPLLLVGAIAGCYAVHSVRWSTGLFATSPLFFAAVAFPSAPEAHAAALRPDDSRTRLVQFRRILWVTAALFLAFVLLQPRSPGLNWGSRYLLLTAPGLLALGLTSIEDALGRARNSVTRFVLLAGVLSAVTAGAVANVRCSKQFHEQQMATRQDLDHVVGIGSAVLVTDFFWLASSLEAEALAPHVFHVGELDDYANAVPHLYDVLEKREIRRFVVRGSARLEQSLVVIGRERRRACTIRRTEEDPGRAYYLFFECE